MWSASLDWVRHASALGFDSMEFLSFPSAYHPDLHSKAADSWIVEIQRRVSADRLPRCQGKGPQAAHSKQRVDAQLPNHARLWNSAHLSLGFSALIARQL
jgi:hypothetical protein